MTITGSGFTAGTTVTFGPNPGTSLIIASTTRLTVTVPAHAAGALHTYVTNPSGHAPLNNNDIYTYAPAPTVAALSPASGLPAGGNRVTITGTGFTAGTTVTFGPNPGTSLSIASTTRLTVTVPAHAAGALHTYVTNPSGHAPLNNNDIYTYAPAPTVAALSPAGGLPAGGNRVTITGTGFVSGITVTFGSNPGTSITVTSTTRLSVTAPAHAAGYVPTYVTSPSGHSPRNSSDIYTYAPPPSISGVSPAVGPPAGGNRVIIRGGGFGPGTSVTFGSNPGTAVSGHKSALSVTAPAHTAGTVDVQVRTPSGVTMSADAYTYASAADGALAVIAGHCEFDVARPATQACIDPSAVVTDSAGNLYIADSLNEVVDKVTPGGTFSIVAGTGNEGPPTPGPATSSDLDVPAGLALDSAGTLYIADSLSNTVEKVTPGGTLSTVAGTGNQGAPTPGPATSSDLAYPSGVAVDSGGNLYIADPLNQVVEKVTPDGTLSIVTGTGFPGSPTPGPATSSDLAYPGGVAVDSAGNLYIADGAYNHVVEKVTADGTLSIIAGTGHEGVPTPGPATNSDLDEPNAVAVDSAGNLYIADAGYDDVVEKVTPDGTLSIIAGTGNEGVPTPGPATNSDLGNPVGVTVDPTGNLYIADSGNLGNSLVEKIVPGGTLSIIAGTGHEGASTPGPATSSHLYFPSGVTVGRAGNVFIADTDNNVVEKVTPSGTLSIIAGMGDQDLATPGPATASDLDNPGGVAVDPNGNVYIADTGNNVVEKVTPSGTLSIIAGTGNQDLATPGPATSSDLDGPSGVSVDSDGNVYIADTGNNVVEKVTPSGTLSIIAGTGNQDLATPGPATSSDLDGPSGVSVDSDGNVYIADTGNNVVEKVTPSGTLSIIAGTGNQDLATPGPATSSDLDGPSGVSVDPDGNLYIADTGNNVVEKVTPSGTLSIIAGTGSYGAPTPGPALSSGLKRPTGVGVDLSGNLYVADTVNSDVEKITF